MSDKPCRCHKNFAYIAPAHPGHCCFLPATQTCHEAEVAEWQAKKRQRTNQSDGGES